MNESIPEISEYLTDISSMRIGNLRYTRSVTLYAEYCKLLFDVFSYVWTDFGIFRENHQMWERPSVLQEIVIV